MARLIERHLALCGWIGSPEFSKSEVGDNSVVR
jgi:hypothetical protein